MEPVASVHVSDYHVTTFALTVLERAATELVQDVIQRTGDDEKEQLLEGDENYTGHGADNGMTKEDDKDRHERDEEINEKVKGSGGCVNGEDEQLKVSAAGAEEKGRVNEDETGSRSAPGNDERRGSGVGVTCTGSKGASEAARPSATRDAHAMEVGEWAMEVSIFETEGGCISFDDLMDLDEWTTENCKESVREVRYDDDMLTIECDKIEKLKKRKHEEVDVERNSGGHVTRGRHLCNEMNQSAVCNDIILDVAALNRQHLPAPMPNNIKVYDHRLTFGQNLLQLVEDLFPPNKPPANTTPAWFLAEMEDAWPDTPHCAGQQSSGGDFGGSVRDAAEETDIVCAFQLASTEQGADVGSVNGGVVSCAMREERNRMGERFYAATGESVDEGWAENRAETCLESRGRRQQQCSIGLFSEEEQQVEQVFVQREETATERATSVPVEDHSATTSTEVTAPVEDHSSSTVHEAAVENLLRSGEDNLSNTLYYTGTVKIDGTRGTISDGTTGKCDYTRGSRHTESGNLTASAIDCSDLRISVPCHGNRQLENVPASLNSLETLDEHAHGNRPWQECSSDKTTLSMQPVVTDYVNLLVVPPTVHKESSATLKEDSGTYQQETTIEEGGTFLKEGITTFNGKRTNTEEHRTTLKEYFTEFEATSAAEPRVESMTWSSGPGKETGLRGDTMFTPSRKDEEEEDKDKDKMARFQWATWSRGISAWSEARPTGGREEGELHVNQPRMVTGHEQLIALKDERANVKVDGCVVVVGGETYGASKKYVVRDKDLWVCPTCGRRLSSRASLSRHRRTQHQMGYSLSSCKLPPPLLWSLMADLPSTSAASNMAASHTPPPLQRLMISHQPIASHDSHLHASVSPTLLSTHTDVTSFDKVPSSSSLCHETPETAPLNSPTPLLTPLMNYPAPLQTLFMNSHAPLRTTLMNSPAPLQTPFMHSPASLSIPLMHSSASLRTPLMNSPSPLQTPLMNSPSPSQTPLMNSPAPLQTPLMNSPSPSQTPLMNSPAPLQIPLMTSPAPLQTPLMNSSAPMQTPLMNLPAPLLTPLMNSCAPLQTPSINLPAPLRTALMNSHAPLQTPLMNSPAPLRTRSMNSPSPLQTPLMNSPAPLRTPSMNSPAPLPTPLLNLPALLQTPSMNLRAPLQATLTHTSGPIGEIVVRSSRRLPPSIVQAADPLQTVQSFSKIASQDYLKHSSGPLRNTLTLTTGTSANTSSHTSYPSGEALTGTSNLLRHTMSNTSRSLGHTSAHTSGTLRASFTRSSHLFAPVQFRTFVPPKPTARGARVHFVTAPIRPRPLTTQQSRHTQQRTLVPCSDAATLSAIPSSSPRTVVAWSNPSWGVVPLLQTRRPSLTKLRRNSRTPLLPKDGTGVMQNPHRMPENPQVPSSPSVDTPTMKNLSPTAIPQKIITKSLSNDPSNQLQNLCTAVSPRSPCSTVLLQNGYPENAVNSLPVRSKQGSMHVIDVATASRQ